MGLFNKNSDDKNLKAPPMPPAPPSLNAEKPASSEPKPMAEPPKLDSTKTLTPPPMPSGTLSDIKKEVTAPTPNQEAPMPEPPKMSEPSLEMPKMDSTPQEPLAQTAPQTSTENSISDDSLFDFSDLEIPSLNENSEVSSNSLDESTQNLNEQIIDVKGENQQNLDYLSSGMKKHSKREEPYFITTSQFKALLEIVDGVKSRVKSSSETHLRLTDIKAEEDIEYENLRKDFQFLEDKLYELDGILFEK